MNAACYFLPVEPPDRPKKVIGFEVGNAGDRCPQKINTKNPGTYPGNKYGVPDYFSPVLYDEICLDYQSAASSQQAMNFVDVSVNVHSFRLVVGFCKRACLLAKKIN